MHMLKMRGLWIFLCLLAVGGMVRAQAAKPAEPKTVANVLDHSISGVEGEFVPAAEAMPEEKYAYVPTSGEYKGVRNFSAQVKHVAAVNYLVGAAILGEKPPVDPGGENGPDSVKSKAEIVKFLKDSFAYVHKAMGSITETNLVTPIKSPFGDGMTTRLGLATLIVGHCFDHYGQMVEYLRLNGIVPPASR
ncbi:MAG TPA: DinB family protein [Candidatus Acidoferrum sp.]|nr:DinB family protein [Candidatus Acidoferrum sp.]